jgi:hypothetical protein
MVERSMPHIQSDWPHLFQRLIDQPAVNSHHFVVATPLLSGLALVAVTLTHHGEGMDDIHRFAVSPCQLEFLLPRPQRLVVVSQ